MSTSSVLAEVLSYAARGWRVFPVHWADGGACSCGDADCKNVGKHPLTTHGLNDASTDPQAIEWWWRRWPHANVGIRTGLVSGFFVLDVDPDKGGDDTLRGFEQTHGELPPTIEALTGGGGRHVYFRADRAIGTNAGNLGAGLDIRAEGGYIVAPPSNHKQGTYDWEVSHHPDDVDLADAPSWLLMLLTTPMARAAPGAAPFVSKIGAGQRNETLAAIAGAMRRQGATEEVIATALLATNTAQCDPPLADDEVRKIAASIGKYRPYFVATPLPANGGNGTTNGHVVTPQSAVNTASRPAINIGEKDLPRIRAEVWRAVHGANSAEPRLFRFGGMLVRLAIDVHGLPVLEELTVDRLRHELGNMATWYVFHGKGLRVPELPPLHIVRDLLADAAPPLPVLLRLVEAPVFGPTGTLQTAPGYDTTSQTYYRPADGFTLATVPDDVDDETLARARAIVDDLLGDFPFAGDAERAHAVGLFLLPYVRDMIDAPVPNHLIEAPTPGSGKGLLAGALLSPAIGHDIPIMTAAGNDEEWRKQLTSQLRTGPSALIIDNVTQPLDSGVLAAALTARTWNDRLLGSNDVVHLPVRCIWVTTANNPVLSTELARRSVRIRLLPIADRPWQRDETAFHHHPLQEWVRDHRSDLVWAALVLIRAWLRAGQPAGRKTLGSYERWSRVIGGILDTIGIPGFLGNLTELYEVSDREGEIWRQFVTKWHERYGETEVSASDLFPVAVDIEGFSFGRANTERSQRTAFGLALGRQRDRVFGPYRILLAGTSHQAKHWRLLDTTSTTNTTSKIVSSFISNQPAGNVGNVGERSIPYVERERKTPQVTTFPKVPHVPPSKQNKRCAIVGDRVWLLNHEGQVTNEAPYGVVEIARSPTPEGPRYSVDGVLTGYDWPDGRDYAVLDALVEAGGVLHWPLDQCEVAMMGAGDV